MTTPFEIDYIIQPKPRQRVDTHHTDDPLEAEDFLLSLLASGARIKAIRCSGSELDQPLSDQMLRIAANRAAAGMLGKSLDLDAKALQKRFGLTR